MSLKQVLTDIADAIRVGTDTFLEFSLEEMPEWVAECRRRGELIGHGEGYDEGYTEGLTKGDKAGYERGLSEGKNIGFNDGYTMGENDGRSEGIEEGRVEGKQAEYDAFWDSYQANGTRTGGFFMFAGYGWNSENYKPKYKVAIGAETYPTYCTSMFERFDNLQKKTPLEINEGDIDFSKATVLDKTFSNANISKVEMDCIPPNLTRMTDTFQMNSISSHKLHTLKLGVNAKTTFSETCFRIGSLINLSFIEGSVVGNSVSFAYSKNLTGQSIRNIVNVLSDTATGKTLTLSLEAVNNQFDEYYVVGNGSKSEEWLALRDTKSNWTINLV